MIMRRNTINSEPKEPIKSYRQRRAQSRSNHLSTTDTKGLQQIEDTLKKRRMSIQEGENLFGSFLEEEFNQQETNRIRTDPVIDEDQKLQETQITKIIQKYGDTMDFIKQVEEEQLLTCKINPQFESKPVKTGIVPQIKNIPTQDSKKATVTTKSTFALTKAHPKIPADLNNFVTPRKTVIKQVPTRIPFTNSIKSDRKIPQTKGDKKGVEQKVSKSDQNKFIKKLEALEDQLMKLGFQKEAEAKWHLKNIMELLKQ